MQVKTMYSWANVAMRTLKVYDNVMTAPFDDSILARLGRYSTSGVWAGKLFCCVAVLLHLYALLLEWLQPASSIEQAPDWPSMQDMLADDAVDGGRGRHKHNRGSSSFG